MLTSFSRLMGLFGMRQRLLCVLQRCLGMLEYLLGVNILTAFDGFLQMLDRFLFVGNLLFCVPLVHAGRDRYGVL